MSVPVTLSDNLIAIPAHVYGHHASLVLDSGNENGALLLVKSFAQRNQLRTGTEAVTGYGFGGLTRAIVTRAPLLEISNFKIDSPLTNLSLDDSGIESGTTDGNIGASLLREFTWTFDVPHNLVYLKPNRWFKTQELDDHSGLVLDTRSGAAKVLFVFPNSPAGRAGISAGDQLSGAADQTLTGSQWHDLLCAPSGSNASFRVNHQGKNRAVTLTLEPYI